jgi:hypothetical protein
LGRLHKEVSNNKDNHGGDGIFIQMLGDSSYKVIRTQIKIQKQEITEKEVNQFQIDMETRGAPIIDQIKERWGPCVVVENILFTTQYYKGTYHPFDSDIGFRLLSHLELDSFWPDDIKSLGEPFGPKRHFTQLSHRLVDGSATPLNIQQSRVETNSS